jgi:malate dehydrogenase (oxaloacetate-decarboxylating)
MQGTVAITLAATPAAVKVIGVPMRDQKLLVFGAGTAGVGIADQIRDAMVRDGASAGQARSQRPGRDGRYEAAQPRRRAAQ